MDAIATVVSEDAVTAPFSGRHAAVVVVEALRGEEVIGATVFGDLLRLRGETGEIEVVARRAAFTFTSMFDAPPAPEHVPAELVPMLQRGATAFRERLIRRGDRLRVRRRDDDPSGRVQLDELLAFEP